MGHVSPREVWRGGLPCPCPAAVLDRNQPGAAPTKAISWGPAPCFSIRKGDPLHGWKNRGVFAVGVTGRRGLWVCGHLGHLLTPRPHGVSPMEAEGPLSWDAGGLHGSRGGVGNPRGERVPVPRYSPGENPQARPPCSMASPSSFQVPGARHPGSGSPQVNAFWGHKGQEAAAAFTDRGVGALGDAGCRVTVPCHVGSTDFREWKPRVQVCRVGAVWGSLSQRRTLSGLSCEQA